MADENLLCHCLEWTRQLIDKKEEVIVNIVVGGFTFSFDNKKNKEQKHKSPSQIKRNLDRQKEFERRFVKIENKETFENSSAKETAEVDTISVATQADLVTNEEVETQTTFSSKEIGIQTDDEEHEYIEELDINEKGEILPKPDEIIIELKFLHDLESWEQVNRHILENLRLKVKGKPCLASNGRHFKIIAMKVMKKDFDKWKFETLNWESIAKPVNISRISR